MTDALPAPLVPPECDLRNFLRMPLEVGRLLSSDTWIAAADDPRLGHALLSLWAEAWRQVPAGSLPDVDLTLQRMSMCPTPKEWQRVRDRALAGWVKCADGRLYHPVVCEMALEGWLEKLETRGRGGEGNAKRWGVVFDRAQLDAEMDDVRAMLAALNPNSPALARRRGRPVKAVLPKATASQSDGGGGAGGDPNASQSDRQGIAEGSQSDRQGIAKGSLKDRNRREGKGYPPNPPPAMAVDNSARGNLLAAAGDRWWGTRAGIEAVGRLLGLGAWDEAASQLGRGEHWLAYRDRVFIAAGDGPWLGAPPGAVPIALALLQGVRH